MSTKKTSQQSAHVRIAVVDVANELVFEAQQSPAEIKAAVTQALSTNSPLILNDVRGREIIVPAEKIGFVDIGEAQERRVGFGAL